MKTLISILLLILISSLPSPLKSSSAVEMYYAKENTIDSCNVMNDREWVISRFVPQEEEYIDDIPWDTKKVIASRFKYPEPARKENVEGSVLITFSYKENGYIEVKTAISDNEKLKDYVVETLQNIKLTQGIVDLSKEYTARFDFRLL